jgi:hypothetical protein
MGKNYNKKPLAVPDPEVELNSYINSLSKYKIGFEGSPFNQIKKFKPIFAFDYISLNNSNLCFNYKELSQKCFHKFFRGIKAISDLTYDDLCSSSFHFHEVDFSKKDVQLSVSTYKKQICGNLNSISNDQLPTLYQFKVFEEARILGFFFNQVFYIVFFDRNHQVYQRK